MILVLKMGNYWFYMDLQVKYICTHCQGFGFISLNRRAHFISVWLNFSKLKPVSNSRLKQVLYKGGLNGQF